MSENTALVVEALKALGKDRVTEDTIYLLQIKLSPADKETLRAEKDFEVCFMLNHLSHESEYRNAWAFKF